MRKDQLNQMPEVREFNVLQRLAFWYCMDGFEDDRVIDHKVYTDTIDQVEAVAACHSVKQVAKLADLEWMLNNLTLCRLYMAAVFEADFNCGNKNFKQGLQTLIPMSERNVMETICGEISAMP